MPGHVINPKRVSANAKRHADIAAAKLLPPHLRRAYLARIGQNHGRGPGQELKGNTFNQTIKDQPTTGDAKDGSGNADER
jgi:hypothetical protein